MESLLSSFRLVGAPLSCEPYGHGHINRTFLVVTDAPRRYILQQINTRVFSDPAGLMENISAVTAYLSARTKDPRGCLRLVPTAEGGSWLRAPDGGCWRVYDFVEDSVCLQQPETEEDFYQSAVAFGGFQHALADFPAGTLHETIPNFHNTPDRYRLFRAALAADRCGRAASVEKEIAFVLMREEQAGALQRMRESGELPLRVTHNDTKLNNVMLDAATHRPLCVIDLDTVMPGLAAYDFGDSIRFGAATAAEDERDLSRVSMSLTRFAAFTRGFLGACPGLTPRERETLPLGAYTMTLECGMRFLTDYLDGDRYFAVAREGHNLDRARTQLALVADMERKREAMAAAVRACEAGE